MSAHTWMCAHVPIVPSQKENRLLTLKRSSHQCLISSGGMDAYNCQYIETTLGVPHKGEGLRVGRGNLFILGLWTRQSKFCKSRSSEAFALIGWFSTFFFLPQHAFPVLRLKFLIFHFCFIPGRKSTPVMAKISLLTQRQK